jgi:ring-1,2-phenylacetyl-CoA epoxidase subunit PaaE
MDTSSALEWQPKLHSLRHLIVSQVTPMTPNAVRITFEPPLEPLLYEAGQYLTFVVQFNGRTYHRSYSLITDSRLDQAPAIVVKRKLGGIISGHLIETVRVGQTLAVTEPAGRFIAPTSPLRERHLVLFGGGSGITPLYAIARSVLYFEPKSTITLIYANSSWEEIILRDAINELEQRFASRLKVMHVLEQPSPQLSSVVGRLDVAQATILINEAIKESTTSVSYYLCGPTAFMAVVQDALATMGVRSGSIQQERFVTETPEKVTGIGTPVTVLFYANEQAYTITVEPGQSLLDAAEQGGLFIASSCRMGDCGTCKCRLRSGEVTMTATNGLTLEEEQEGYVLSCVGFPRSENVILETPA